ncbi:MAG: site-specific DNA-methyltransferase [Chloroflexi bacterium]|nr:site-specific DNA-methyltransferase [Chloroflexota bacterium]
MPDPAVLPFVASELGTSVVEIQFRSGFIPPDLAKVVVDLIDHHTVLDAVISGADNKRCDNKQNEIPCPVLETELGKLYQADCLNVLPALESRSIDCIFADPPFNLGKDYGQGIDDERSDADYLTWCFQWLEELVRVLKPGGSLFLYNLPKWNIHLASYLDRYLEFRHWIAVDIKFSLPIPGRLYPSHYSLLYFVKGPRPRVFNPPRLPLPTCRHCGGEIKDYGGYKNKMNPRGVNLTDVWTDIPPVRHRRYKNRGANQLALKMLDRILDIATNEDDIVLDPFAGSGTTLAACELRNRRWIGIEIGDCKPIAERLSDLDRERRQLDKIRSRINVLFTSEALQLRAQFGHDTSRYQLLDTEENNETSSTGDSQNYAQLDLFRDGNASDK